MTIFIAIITTYHSINCNAVYKQSNWSHAHLCNSSTLTKPLVDNMGKFWVCHIPCCSALLTQMRMCNHLLSYDVCIGFGIMGVHDNPILNLYEYRVSNFWLIHTLISAKYICNVSFHSSLWTQYVYIYIKSTKVYQQLCIYLVFFYHPIFLQSF